MSVTSYAPWYNWNQIGDCTHLWQQPKKLKKNIFPLYFSDLTPEQHACRSRRLSPLPSSQSSSQSTHNIAHTNKTVCFIPTSQRTNTRKIFYNIGEGLENCNMSINIFLLISLKLFFWKSISIFSKNVTVFWMTWNSNYN